MVAALSSVSLLVVLPGRSLLLWGRFRRGLLLDTLLVSFLDGNLRCL